MLKLLRFSLLSLCMWAGFAYAVPSGYIHSMSGEVTISEVGKSPVKAKLGDLFEQGTSFATGADGKATLKFADGQIVSLSPNTQFTVTVYGYNTASVADSNIVFSLTRGGLRFITGLIGQTNNSKFSLRTPTLTAGVRGTDGEVIIAQDGSVLVSVNNGVVTMTSPSGTVSVTAGNFTFYPPNSSTPTVSNVPVSSLPPAIAALVQSLVALAAEGVPAANPVDVTQEAKKVVDAASNQSAPTAPGGPPPATPGGSGGGGGSKS
jgi:hypothetical protein